MGKAQLQILLFCVTSLVGSLLFLVLFQLRLANIDASLRSQIVLICAFCFVSVSLLACFCSKYFTSSHLMALEKATSKILSCIGKDPVELMQGKILPIDELAQKIVEELEFSQQGQRLIADFASDVLCCLSEDRKFLNLNSQAETILGYSESSLLAVPIEAIVLDEYKCGIIEFFERCKKKAGTEGDDQFEFRVMKPSGTFVDLSLHSEWSNSMNCYFCLAKNITAIKENERLKAEISAMVTHDLRTPITGFRFLLENLESGVLGKLNETGQEQVVKAAASIEQVLLLVNQLLDVEKIEGGQMELAPTIIASCELYKSSAAMVQALAAKKKVSLEFPSSDTLLFADFERTKQVLSNLLSNAIKWSPENSRVEISDESDGAMTKISVKDLGPGIAQSKVKVIFERFKSLDGRSDKEMASSGLGLYICKRLTELQGGSIGVKSTIGQGSTFWFTLPTGELDD